MHLCMDFQSNVDYFSTGPPVFGIAAADCVLLAGISASLTAIITDLVALITACNMACVIRF